MTENRKETQTEKKKDPLLISSYDINFNTRICMYIPSRDREGVELPVWTHEDAINHYKMLFSSFYGGYTMDRGSVGGWYSEEQKKLIEEDIIKIYSYTSDFEENEKKLMKEIKRSVDILNQSCITLEINNKMYFIDNKEEERHPVLDPEPEPEPEEEAEPEPEPEFILNCRRCGTLNDTDNNLLCYDCFNGIEVFNCYVDYVKYIKRICNEKNIYYLCGIYNHTELKDAEAGDIFEESDGMTKQYYKVMSLTNNYFRYKELHKNNIVSKYENNIYDIDYIANEKAILYHTKNHNIAQRRKKKGIIRAVKKQYIKNDMFISSMYYI